MGTSFRYCERTQFSGSLFGKLVLGLVILVMNFFTLVLELWFTSLSLIHFRNYVKKRLFIVAREDNQMSQANRNLTKMSIQLSVLSTAASGFVLLYNLLILFMGDDNQFYYYITFGACLCVTLKMSLSFFFFYFYNNNFKRAFKRLFCFKHIVDQDDDTRTSQNRKSTLSGQINRSLNLVAARLINPAPRSS
jgi:hypothetical protein